MQQRRAPRPSRRPGRSDRARPALRGGRPRLALLALVAAVTACATPTTGTPPDDAAESPAVTAPATDDVRLSPGALTAEIRQSRSDWGVRRVQVRVRNRTDVPVDVATATLEASTVEGPGTSDPARGRSVPAGGERDFPVLLGRPLCPAGGTASASVVVRTADGQEVALTPLDPQGHLSRIQSEDCAEQRVREAVRLELAPSVTASERDGRLVGALTLTATVTDPTVEVAVTRIDGTVLLAPLDGPSWAPAELAAVGTTPTTTRLEFLPARCDPHAVAEDKRGTFLPVHVTLDGEQQPVVHLSAPDPLRGEVYDHIADACRW